MMEEYGTSQESQDVAAGSREEESPEQKIHKDIMRLREKYWAAKLRQRPESEIIAAREKVQARKSEFEEETGKSWSDYNTQLIRNNFSDWTRQIPYNEFYRDNIIQHPAHEMAFIQKYQSILEQHRLKVSQEFETGLWEVESNEEMYEDLVQKKEMSKALQFARLPFCSESALRHAFCLRVRHYLKKVTEADFTDFLESLPDEFDKEGFQNLLRASQELVYWQRNCSENDK